MNRMRYLKNVATLALDEKKCTGCGLCLDVCPHGVFNMNAKSVRITDRDACMECGACAVNCPVSAVTVQSGVGCAAAVINQLLGRTGECCCGPEDGRNGAGCCC
ncbi:MAG: mercury methylation ferredoxin HgcB [Smithellaceae bacterium]